MSRRGSARGGAGGGPAWPRRACATAAIAAGAIAGCARTATLTPVGPRRVPWDGGGRVVVEQVIDVRPGDRTALGLGHDRWLGVDYLVDAEGDLASWLSSHVSAALAEGGGAAGARDEARLRVRVVRFELTGGPWVRGSARFELSLRRRDGVPCAEPLLVEAGFFATEGDDAAWSALAARLGRWSGLAIARWASACRGEG